MFQLKLIYVSKQAKFNKKFSNITVSIASVLNDEMERDFS